MSHLKKISFLLLSMLIMVITLSFTNINIKKVADNKWHGVASYYHSKFNGRKTFTGEIFNNKHLTAANNFLKLGTLVKVTNLLNGKTVIVKVNDRMNKGNKRLIDLSQAAAKQLGIIHQGLGNVSIEVMGMQPDFLALR